MLIYPFLLYLKKPFLFQTLKSPSLSDALIHKFSLLDLKVYLILN